MNEAEAEEHLLELELFGMRFGLDRMRGLTAALGLPQRRFASIHVVGSNGKTSTTRMIAALLERSGLRTGSFTSPHLESFAERIEVGGARVSGEELAEAVTRAAAAAEALERTLEPDNRVTQFEALTAAAFHLLARRGVEVAVIEAGLGGRHDATNVIPSRVQVLTAVSLEHTRWLGDDLASIAEEKLAVVQDHGVVVTGELPPEAEEVVRRVVAECHASRAPAGEEPEAEGAEAPFQRRNLGLAAAAARAFAGGLEPGIVGEVADALRIEGRLERVAESPLELHDGAHNPAAARALAAALPEVVGERPLTLVLSVLDDKDAGGVLAALAPRCGHVVLTRSAHPRAVQPEDLAALVEAAGLPAPDLVPDPREAVSRARAVSGAAGAVLVTGSLHLIADLRRAVPSARLSTM